MREKVRFCVALCCSVVMVLLASCRYSLPDLPAEGMSRKTKDSLTYLSKYHYTWNTNLEVLDDSVRLEYLPLKDAYVTSGMVNERDPEKILKCRQYLGKSSPFTGSAGVGTQ